MKQSIIFFLSKIFSFFCADIKYFKTINHTFNVQLLTFLYTQYTLCISFSHSFIPFSAKYLLCIVINKTKWYIQCMYLHDLVCFFILQYTGIRYRIRCLRMNTATGTLLLFGSIRRSLTDLRHSNRLLKENEN